MPLTPQELQFAKQSGVPIIPGLVEANGYKASGWLGVVTAGLLWVPLYDVKAGIEQLCQQIHIAMPGEAAATDSATAQGSDRDGVGGVDSGVENQATSLFSVEEMREELLRLRADLAAAASSKATRPLAAVAGGPCPLPAGVPELPANLRVSPEMQQLALALLSPNSTTSRCSFVGMGVRADTFSHKAYMSLSVLTQH